MSIKARILVGVLAVPLMVSCSRSQDKTPVYAPVTKDDESAVKDIQQNVLSALQFPLMSIYLKSAVKDPQQRAYLEQKLEANRIRMTLAEEMTPQDQPPLMMSGIAGDVLYSTVLKVATNCKESGNFDFAELFQSERSNLFSDFIYGGPSADKKGGVGGAQCPFSLSYSLGLKQEGANKVGSAVLFSFQYKVKDTKSQELGDVSSISIEATLISSGRGPLSKDMELKGNERVDRTYNFEYRATVASRRFGPIELHGTGALVAAIKGNPEQGGQFTVGWEAVHALLWQERALNVNHGGEYILSGSPRGKKTETGSQVLTLNGKTISLGTLRQKFLFDLNKALRASDLNTTITSE